jgi:preprotein translocase subunit SecB
MDATKQPGLKIDQVFLLRATFAHREDVFQLPPTTPITDMPVQMVAAVTGKVGNRGAAMKLRAYTEPDAQGLYAFDIEVGAVVSAVEGEENLDPLEFISANGVIAFYPYLREAVANITMKGRFGPMWMKPINFFALAQPDDEEQSASQVGSGLDQRD